MTMEEERLKGLLWFAWHEFNAIRARSGAPTDRHNMPLVSEAWWSELTDMFEEAIGQENATPWPSKEAKAILAERCQDIDQN